MSSAKKHSAYYLCVCLSVKNNVKNIIDWPPELLRFKRLINKFQLLTALISLEIKVACFILEYMSFAFTKSLTF